MLAAEERRTLLRIARASVTARVTAAAAPPVDSTETRLGGAFVTLRIAQALRGCIGRVTADRPLAETVRHVAAAAASEDPRFPPVRAEELGEVVIEVSVIGPLEVCAGPAEIEVGRHGVRRRRRAAPRPASAAGGDRVGLGSPHVPHPDVCQGGSAAGRLEEGCSALSVRGGGLR